MKSIYELLKFPALHCQQLGWQEINKKINRVDDHPGVDL